MYIYGKKKRDEYMAEISSEANKGMLFVILVILLAVCPTGDDWRYKIVFCILVYGITFIPLIAFIYFLTTGYTYLILSSLAGLIFYIIIFVGLLGKLTCLCLTHPCNWTFLMLLSCIFTITGNLICIIDRPESEKGFGYTFLQILCGGNVAVCLAFFIQSIRCYRKMKEIYIETKLSDLRVVDECVRKELEEMIESGEGFELNQGEDLVKSVQEMQEDFKKDF